MENFVRRGSLGYALQWRKQAQDAVCLLCYNPMSWAIETVGAFRRNGTFANKETECTTN